MPVPVLSIEGITMNKRDPILRNLHFSKLGSGEAFAIRGTIQSSRYLGGSLRSLPLYLVLRATGLQNMVLALEG